MEEVIAQLVEKVQSRYYGKYRGFVADNDDPLRQGRLRLRIPSVLGEAVTNWALPCLPFGGLADQGLFSVPEIGAQVWVEFEAGALDYPLWTGTFWTQQDAVPAEVKSPPTTRQFKTPGGHYWLFEDAEDEQRVRIEHSTGASLDIDAQGTINLADAGGATVTLDAENGVLRIEDANGNTLTLDQAGTVVEDANGNRVEMGAAGITVKGMKVVVEGSQVMLGGEGGEPLIKGQSFLSLFMSHVHTASPTGGPTSPPIPQGEMSTLSMKVTST